MSPTKARGGKRDGEGGGRAETPAAPSSPSAREVIARAEQVRARGARVKAAARADAKRTTAAVSGASRSRASQDGGRGARVADAVFKTCTCGKRFTCDEWRALRRAGIWDESKMETLPLGMEPLPPFELRTCDRCGSTISQVIPYDGGTRYPPADD